jgi:hypothetical protein
MLDWPLSTGWIALHEGNITQEGRENLKRGFSLFGVESSVSGETAEAHLISSEV